MDKNFELVVIGAGPGGYVAAIRAAQLGLKVAIIEKDEVGGTCLNRGCIPTKTLLHSAQLYLQAQSFEAIGITTTGLSYDFVKMVERKEAVVSKLRSGIEQLLKANKIEIIKGHATLCPEKRVRVRCGEEETMLQGEHILIATGARAIKPEFEGSDLPGVLTSDDLLQGFNHDYKKLVIVGGGVIGVEFASIYSALGCEVTIIEAMDRVLPTMDREISQNLSMILKKRGVKIYTNAILEKISDAEGLLCRFKEKEVDVQLRAEAVLIAIGRRPSTEALWEQAINIQLDKGRIVVDETFKTNINGVYAIGDVSSTLQLAHLASAQGIVFVEGLLNLEPSINLAIVPTCVYTEPEIATVGMTVEQAADKGIEIKSGKFILTAMGKPTIEMGDRSFIKLVMVAESHVIIGAQMMCQRATELISELTSAIANQLTVEQLKGVIRPHPTYSEAITETLEDFHGQTIHSAPRKT